MFQGGLLNSRSQQVVSSPSSTAKANSILILDEVYNKHGIPLQEVNEGPVEYQKVNHCGSSITHAKESRRRGPDHAVLPHIQETSLLCWKNKSIGMTHQCLIFQYYISIFAFPHRNQKCPCKTFWLLISLFSGAGKSLPRTLFQLFSTLI